MIDDDNGNIIKSKKTHVTTCILKAMYQTNTHSSYMTSCSVLLLYCYLGGCRNVVSYGIFDIHQSYKFVLKVLLAVVGTVISFAGLLA
jgi:hypothetical protein